MPSVEPAVLAALQNIATRLRIESVRSTTEAGSGHPTTCCSAADLVAALFFVEMRYDPAEPQGVHNDRFVLSKGHAAPLLYAAWAEAGYVARTELMDLRKITSDLEGHPTPRLRFVDVATGSLGQGLAAGVGIALNARRIGSAHRTYVLLGDGEVAEGSVWEAASAASAYGLDSLCAIVDMNRLGQSSPTQLGHDLEQMAARWRAFGWHALTVDGHDMPAIIDALAAARATTGRPAVVIARTVKGKGISFTEDKNGWHGKPLKKGEELETALRELEAQLVDDGGTVLRPERPDAAPNGPPPPHERRAVAFTDYASGAMVATREAYGTALALLGDADDTVVALDADVKNSTFSERFEKGHPERFYQFYIAEQAMVGAAMGLASRGAIPFPSTFACFLTRAADFIRMAGISALDVKLAGSHAGVSIGEDGPSQMALEDLAMMRAVPGCAVVYPCDAVSAERLVVEMAYRPGPAYMRTSRPKTPVIYGAGETFPIGGSKVLRQSAADVATVVAAGVTVFEALRAYDELKAGGIDVRVIDLYSLQPVDEATLAAAARDTARFVTVEDHYAAGGLGDAVDSVVSPLGARVERLAVREIPRSGGPDELIDRFGISARRIVDAVRRGL
ncbi:MAG: transketolase [Vicinamibacteraceae bacterium]|nr:transketolase [Vicinamibacteraceae bacterium]